MAQPGANMRFSPINNITQKKYIIVVISRQRRQNKKESGRVFPHSTAAPTLKTLKGN